MSWKQAQEDARRWVDQTKLKREEIEGKLVDLRPYAGLISAFEGQYRTMVLGAAKRVLKARGAAGSILPE
jgi:hypothetical protein